MALAAATLPAALLPVAVLLLLERRVSVMSLILMLYMPSVVGMGILIEARGIPEGSYLILLAPSLLAAGYLVVAGPRRPAAQSRRRAHELSQAERSAVWVGVFVVIFLTVLHFIRAGVPVLNSQVETARFALGSSGLLGMPSRAALFSLPVLALATACVRRHMPHHVIWVVWAVFVMSRLAMGFKGGILEVFVVILTVALIQRRLLQPKTLALVVIFAICAVTYAVLIGRQYQTVASSGGAGLDYFTARLTTGTAEAAWELLAAREWVTGGESAAVKDLNYFAGRYFGLGSGRDFATDQLVSSLIYDTPRSGTSFLVPVTVGGAAYLMASGGFLTGFVGLLVFGAIIALTSARLYEDSRLVQVVIAGAVLTACRIFIANGAGVYLLINMTVGALLFLLPYWMTLTLTRSTAGRANPPWTGGAVALAAPWHARP